MSSCEFISHPPCYALVNEKTEYNFIYFSNVLLYNPNFKTYTNTYPKEINNIYIFDTNWKRNRTFTFTA